MSLRKSDHQTVALFIVAGVNFEDSDYDSPFQVNFDYVSSHAGWRHQWAEQISLHLQAPATRYENNADTEVTTDSLDAQISFVSQYMESLKMLLWAGWVSVAADHSGSSSSTIPEPDDNAGSSQLDLSVTFRPQTRVWSHKFWLVVFCPAP